MKHPYSIYPIGDSAITIDLGNRIDEALNRRALAIRDRLSAGRSPAIIDIIVAYSSLSVFYDPSTLLLEFPACRNGAFSCMSQWLAEAWEFVDARFAPSGEDVRDEPFADPIRIPVCYGEGYSPDLDWLARDRQLPRKDIIELHTSRVYQVYMIGFLPGFPYMAKVDARLEVPRKGRPVPVLAGGVGIAGIQTGIYPVNSPGGWIIIGRTPLKLFDPSRDVPVTLKTGDRIQFFPIDQEEFLYLA